MPVNRRRFLRNVGTLVPSLCVEKASFSSGAEMPPQIEARGVWYHTEELEADPSKGKAAAKATLQRLADSHFNLILPFVTSEYLVAQNNPDYLKRHPAAGWDSLGYVIHEATRQGFAVQMWYSFTGDRKTDSPDYDPKVGGNPDWSARRIDELVPGYPAAIGNAYALGDARKLEAPDWLADSYDIPLPAENPRRDVCPQHAAARRWQLDMLAKTLERYPEISGIHVEEPGYTYGGNCVCDLCRAVFQELYGKALAEHLDSLEAQDFRCLGTSAFMVEVYRLLRQRNPNFALSTNGTPNWRRDRRMLARDWARWARMGWLDYFVPMDYSASTETFRQRLSLTVTAVSQDCPVYAGIGIRWSGHPQGNISPGTVVEEIEIAREMGTTGVVLFYAGAVDQELAEALLRGPFRTPAKLPEPKR